MPRSARVNSSLPTGDAAAASGRGLKRAAAVPARPRRPKLPDRRIEPVILSVTMQDYALTEADIESYAEIGRFEQLGDPCHYRIKYLPRFAEGRAEFYGIADGFFVHLSDAALAEPYAMSVTAADMLRLRIAGPGAGDAVYRPAQGDVLELDGPSAAIIIEPAGQQPAEAVFAGRTNSVQVYLHRDALKLLYAGGEHELPPVLQAFLAGDLRRTVARRLALSPSMLRCLEDLQSCALHERGRRLFIQSKAIELLCFAFEALAQEDGVESPDASALTMRGVRKAQLVLMENYVTPPSLDDLAHQVGLSRSRLCAGFRQIVGQTVFDYVTDLRMQHALAMLSLRDASITQIAHAVGFSHLSSFSVAVQRRFGTSPSKLRRKGLPAV